MERTSSGRPEASGPPGALEWLPVGGRQWDSPVEPKGHGQTVWSCQVPVPPRLRETFLGVLSPEEAAQARRFVPERARELYVAAHGLLRLLLGAAIGVEAGSLRFAAGPFGKPRLAGAAAAAPAFNIAHSGSRVLVALSSAGEVGVDVEAHRALRDGLDIAERFYSEREAAELRRLDGRAREELFFRLWSRKEAVLKAAGLGVAGLSRETDVLGESPHASAGSTAVAGGEGGSAVAIWWIDLPLGRGYAGALAAGLPIREVALRAIEGERAEE